MTIRNQEHAKAVVVHVGQLSAEFNAATTPAPLSPDCDVLLIDLSSLFYPAWHASGDSEVGRAFEDTMFSVGKLLGAIPHKYVAVCCDHPPYWRKTVSPQYKAQRDTPSQVMVEQFRRVRERLHRDGRLVWRCEGFEADDVIATAAVKALANGMTVTVATGDKDLMQLVDANVRVFSVNKRETFGEAEVFEKCGVAPRLVRDWLALCGDKSDNIPGVPGVGPKKASEVLALFGSGAAAIGAARDGDERIKPAVRKALAEHQGYETALELVTLRYDAPIEFLELFEERRPEPLETRSYDDMSDTDEAEYESAPEQPKPPTPERKSEPPKPPTDLALAPATSFELQLEPTSMSKALAMADVLINSRMYPRFGNKEAIFAIVVRGREMGLGALTALDSMHMVEGRPTMSAHLIVARAKQHPNCEHFQMIESDDVHAVFETKAKSDPKPTRHAYTYAQAVSAGVAPENPRRTPIKDDRGKDSRGQWEKRPAEMLRKTCAVQLARIVYPDAALGLYATEEIDPEAT